MGIGGRVVLRDGRQDMDGELAGLGMSTATKSALDQRSNEGHIAREAGKAGNEQHRTTLATLFQCGQELGSVGVPAAALNLRVLVMQRIAAAQVAGDGLALRLQR